MKGSPYAPGVQICIIGAGKMSRLLVKHLDSKGCGQIILLNRSLPRAHALAEEFPTVAFSIRLMSELMQSVAESDLVFAASGSGTQSSCGLWSIAVAFQLLSVLNGQSKYLWLGILPNI